MKAITGTTKLGESFAALLNLSDEVVLKAYASADGQSVRIVLPELVSFVQVLIDIDRHWLEFDRHEKNAREKLRIK